jgi:hypothetical protein
MIAAGVALAASAYFLGPGALAIFSNTAILNTLMGIGITTALSGTAGLLNTGPTDPSNIGPEGQLPIQTPNPLWRIVYGIFQFAGTVTFVDGPFLSWVGTGSGTPCNNQYIQRVHTLAAHQIAGFIAVTIDGQSYNFGTDLVLLTTANNGSNAFGPPGMWGFINNSNPWMGAILFAFDCGDPGNSSQPFPFLVSGAQITTPAGPFVLGSTRWPAGALQRGRAKVHVILHYVPGNNLTAGPLGGAPQPYVLGSGRIPTIEFKIMGRLIKDYRVVTAWQADTTYPAYGYVLAAGGGGSNPAGGDGDVFVTTGGGTSGAATAPPDFASVSFGGTITDGSVTWLNVGVPIYAAGSGQTALNNPASLKLGGPGSAGIGPGTYLVADAWQGSMAYGQYAIIEAPIGVLQMALTAFTSGVTRPPFVPNGVPVLDPNVNLVGQVVAETNVGGGSWVCLGRSMYATCMPDDDNTTNQGGFSNPALVVADYLQTPKNEFGLGATLTGDSIDTVIAAANLADEPVVIEVFPPPAG